MSARVCMVATTTATEPGALLATRLRSLTEAGWDARLLCKGSRYADDPALADGTRVERTARTHRRLPPRGLLRHPRWPLRYLRAAGEADVFDQRLLQLRPDLIHFHSGAAAWKAMRLKRLLGCAVVVSFRADVRDLHVPDTNVLWDADLLLFPDAATRARALALGCPPTRAEVLAPPPWTDGRERATRAGERLRIVSAGPLIWEQGFEHAIDAVGRLAATGVECDYRLLGDGPHAAAVAFARHQLGLAQRVEIAPSAGLLDDLCDADVFVDPSVSDTTSPTPLATAQALGVPVVATPGPDLDPDAAIVVPRRRPDALAAALERLAADPALRERMGRAARAAARRDDRAQRHAGQLSALYERVLRR